MSQDPINCINCIGKMKIIAESEFQGLAWLRVWHCEQCGSTRTSRKSGYSTSEQEIIPSYEMEIRRNAPSVRNITTYMCPKCCGRGVIHTMEVTSPVIVCPRCNGMKVVTPESLTRHELTHDHVSSLSPKDITTLYPGT